MPEIFVSSYRTLLARIRRQTRETGGARGPRDSRRPDSPRRPSGPGRGRLHAFAVTALTVLTAFTWLLGIGLLASCGAAEKPDSTATAPPKVNAGNGENAGKEGAGAKAQDDVRVTDCQGTAPGKAGVHATVEITNSTDRPWGYSGNVLFKDPAGKKIATGLFAKNAVEPGKKVEAADIPGDTYERYPDVTCELDGVRRNPPK